MSFLDADYAAIEGRIVCWLAGQEDALDEYRQGVDRYKRMASVIYGIPEDQVNKHPQRYVGKTAILLLGFQGGAPKFREACKKQGGYELPEGLEFTVVGKFRKKHSAIVRLWNAAEKAAKNAITHPGRTVIAEPERFYQEGTSKPLPTFQRLEFQCRDIEGIQFLLLRLPSGRKLAYPRPKIIPSKRFENKTVVAFYGNILGTKWGTVDTYGGKFVENITQAVAADIMAHGAHNCEREGYQIATLIHDQCLCFKKPGQSVERLVELLTDLPDWGKGLPIEAEGSLVPFYKKD